MPAKPPYLSTDTLASLEALGRFIKEHRKELKLSATATAEAAGISRVTLYRIEKGYPAATIGAYAAVMAAVGLPFNFGQNKSREQARTGWIPARIHLADYPQLRRLAWQVTTSEALTPVEASDIYARNWRHVDQSALNEEERELIDALRLGLGLRTGNV